MLNIEPEAENTTNLSKNEVWLSEPQTMSDSIREDASGTSQQVTNNAKHTLRPPSQTSPFSDTTTNFSEKAPAETSSKAKHNDLFESDEVSRLSESTSIRINPSEEIANIAKSTLENPSRPTCRDGSSLSSISDEEASGLYENPSNRYIPSREISDIRKNRLEPPSQRTYRDGSISSFDSGGESSSMSLSVIPFEQGANISRNTLHASSAPTCKDGSSLSLFSDDETSMSETALATIGYDNEVETSSCESEEEADNVVSQLPRNLVAQTPQVLVDNSSDVHIGPHFQYSGPITVKQYITLNGREAIDSDNSSSNAPSQMPELKDIVNVTLKPQGKDGNKSDSSFSEVITDVKKMNNFVINANYSPKLLNNGVKTNGINIPEDTRLSGSEDTLLNIKKKFLKMRYILISLTVVIILSICVTLSLVLPGNVSSLEIKPRDINMTCKSRNLRISKGEKTIQWVVNITSNIGKLNVDWYGPGCNLIEKVDGPSNKYEIDIIYQKNGKMETVLRVLNVTVSDRGLYKLHAYNDKGEQWDYFTLTVLGGDHIVACYVASWAYLRRDQGMYTVDDVDPSQCTHLLYAFAHLNTTTNTVYSVHPDYDLGKGQKTGAYEKMTSLKNENPHLKVLISVGGWEERVKNNYTIVAELPDKRKEFIASVVAFISKYNFDGLDLHWQYPTEQWGTPADKQLFVSLLKELREEFDKQGKNWLLTTPIGVMPDTIQGAYNIPEVTKYVDYMFALCYAYHGFWDHHTGPNAPLYRLKPGDELNVEASIRKLLKLGAQKEKLVLGLALNGRTFILENEKDSEEFGGQTVGEGFTGPYVQETGSWGYNEICSALVVKYSNWVVHWDNETRTPFMTNKDKFLSYDNERSLTEKVIFAIDKKLAGVVTYALDTDDFRGVCASYSSGETNYPLMRAINRAFYAASYGPMEPCKNAHNLE